MGSQNSQVCKQASLVSVSLRKDSTFHFQLLRTLWQKQVDVVDRVVIENKATEKAGSLEVEKGRDLYLENSLSHHDNIPSHFYQNNQLIIFIPCHPSTE